MDLLGGYIDPNIQAWVQELVFLQDTMFEFSSWGPMEQHVC